jgi:hypothetical protein
MLASFFMPIRQQIMLSKELIKGENTAEGDFYEY